MTNIERQPLILVADDDKEFRERIAPEALERRLGARVLKAKDVLQACMTVAEHAVGSGDPLDLIVLDMHMPLHDNTIRVAEDGGIRFLRSYRLVQCPVVVFTAYPSYENCVRALGAGAAAYVPKASLKKGGTSETEGGLDALVDTCRALLEAGRVRQSHVPPDDQWLTKNYDWLKAHFASQWVAFVEPARARAAGIAFSECDGLALISSKSKERLERQMFTSLALLEDIPPIVQVPAASDDEGLHSEEI
jgi:CheY-like chemotaxis protein